MHLGIRSESYPDLRNIKRTIVIVFFLHAIVLPAWAQEQPLGSYDLYEDNKKAVLYLGSAEPEIDGDFAEWQGLAGSSPTKVVFGSKHDGLDAEGFFILRTDNKRLFIYAEVTDDLPNANDLPAPLAWRSDSVEVYLGVQTARHTKFARDDNHIRLVPVSKTDPFSFDISVNDRSVAQNAKAAVVFTEKGYTIEASIPLNLLLIRRFSPGQAIRLDFQVNDADRTERDRLLHWSSPKDDTYFDPSGWGDGVVVELSAN